MVGWRGAESPRPYLWTEADGIRDLELPSGLDRGVAYGINDAGQIVGSGAQGSSPSWEDGGRVVLWTVDQGGAVISTDDLGAFGGRGAKGHAINGAGGITGVVWGEPDGEPSTFVWSELRGVRMLPLGTDALAMNDRVEVAGGWRGQAAVWVDGSLVTFGPEMSLARGINTQGDVVGELVQAGDGGKTVGFVWTGGTVLLLETPSQADHGRARSINEDGLVVGEGFVPNLVGGEAALWVPR